MQSYVLPVLQHYQKKSCNFFFCTDGHAREIGKLIFHPFKRNILLKCIVLPTFGHVQELLTIV